MESFISYYKKMDSSIIALKEILDPELIKNYGVCFLEDDKQITDFEEKPEKPKCNFASTACYLFKKEDMMLIKKYLTEGNSPDAMGFFITWLINNTEIFGYIFKEDWFDIGSFEQLEEAREKYS